MRGTTVSKIHKMDVFLNFWFHSKGERERERWVLNNYRKNPECVTTLLKLRRSRSSITVQPPYSAFLGD